MKITKKDNCFFVTFPISFSTSKKKYKASQITCLVLMVLKSVFCFKEDAKYEFKINFSISSFFGKLNLRLGKFLVNEFLGHGLKINGKIEII
ncbi:hypothetical protein BpHYR1_025592 [Brachionus plicatilis]|uniref:Uncharacterized protein n=1 Tax=Brachionus plicatilis TaxID=10195 RepID=A0A3M7S4K9_BRAPC|nr:hypothetical protein BpHYR1_025592 [Brachionus plicatilis]